MKCYRLIFIIIFLVFVTTILNARGAWHPEKTYWPRTLIDSSQAAIDEVKTRVTVEPYLSIYDNIKTTSDVDYTSCTTQLEKAVVARCAAFRYLIDDQSTYADKAKEYLLVMQRESYANVDEQYRNILWDSEMLSLACITYDFLKGNNYDFSGDETAVRTKIQDIAAEMYYDLVSSSPWSGLHLLWEIGFGEQINYGVKFASALGMCAIVLNTETSGDTDRQPETWINYAMQKTNLQFNNWLVNEQGMWAEGPHYLTFTATSFLPFAISHNNFVDGQTEDYGGEVLPPLLFNDNFQGIGEWVVKIRQPNGARPDFDDSFLDPYFLNGMLAEPYDNDVLAWDYVHANNPYFVDATSNNISVEAICAYDNVAYPGTTEPLFSPTQFLPEAGQAIFRSDWSEDAVYMCLLAENGQAREGGRTHEHPDNGSFIIYALGELLAMDSGYISWDKRDSVRYAKNHSMILVDGEGPPAATLTTAEGTDAYLGEYFDTDGLDYACEITSYQNTDFMRQVTFINNSYFTITDWVGSSSTHEYSWLLHGNGGGTTGNGFSMGTNGSAYTVNNVTLHVFGNSSYPMTLDSYDDYHDDGTYDVPAIHTVTRGQVNADSTIFAAFLIPAESTKDVTYTSINLTSGFGGTFEMGSEKTIHLLNYEEGLLMTDYFGIQIGFNGDVLNIARESDLPRNIFMTNTQNFVYGDKSLIATQEVAITMGLNIGATSADGYVNESCVVEFFTGNEPTGVTGGNYLGFVEGITTIAFSADSYFTIDVEWSLDYAIDAPTIDTYNLSVYPNPFNSKNDIAFYLPSHQHVTIEVFNIKGQKIAVVLDNDLEAGQHNAVWNGKDYDNKLVGNGTYLYKIYFSDHTLLQKVNILR
ncbi:MAG TPA: T9SS type A sorting domain-containing protein [Candidatus Cloacimonetes bacterium]|nr:T9SS type A sorting domain-containing protein [Candidatus Cloacimonadota bacterium]HEX38255.1 T9SS type A sorting domain-containing protein [Candidatus Cloacimonadota bacterium]